LSNSYSRTFFEFKKEDRIQCNDSTDRSEWLFPSLRESINERTEIRIGVEGLLSSFLSLARTVLVRGKKKEEENGTLRREGSESSFNLLVMVVGSNPRRVGIPIRSSC